MSVEEEIQKEKLIIEIIIKRQKMIEMAQITGLNSKETIEISQELDKLLNEYQLILRNNGDIQPFFQNVSWGF